MIEAKIQHSIDSMTPMEYRQMVKIGAAIRDGYTTVEAAFETRAQASAPTKPDQPPAKAPPKKNPQEPAAHESNNAPAEPAKSAEVPPQEQAKEATAAAANPAPAKDNSIERVSAACYDICKNRTMPMDDMLAEMFPGKPKGKLTLEEWDKFYRSLM
jgi:hypothetical protein